MVEKRNDQHAIMYKASLIFRVFFEGPFWIGILERESEERHEVTKTTLGKEKGAMKKVP